MSELYPWPGKYTEGVSGAPVAVVTLSEDFSFEKEKVAIWGPMKTENLGIEKVIANVLSNPNIRFLIVCGKEIRGHKSGGSLIKLWENGVDEKGRIIDAPGAVPYIENISDEAVERFRNQVEMIDLVDVLDEEEIEKKIVEGNEKDPGSYGEPYIAVSIKEREESRFEADLALHSSLKVTPWGEVAPLEED